MKRLFLTLVLPMLTVMSVMAMSDARIREAARFLTDRMAYELQLTPAQYEDCFEVNYDFIYEANNLMDDVVYGYSDAIDSYYDYLDYRNEDLRYILNATQYGIFLGLDYFFRPIYTTAHRWAFRIYDVYHNHNYYYYGLPNCYHTYHGLHSHHHHHGGYYVDRYTHVHHAHPAPIHRGPHYDTHRHNDFGDRYHKREHGGHNNSHGHNNHDARPGGHNNHGNGGHNNHGNGGHNNHGNAGQGGNNHGNGGHNNHGNAGQGGNNHGNHGNARPEMQHRSSERSSANRSHEQHSNGASRSHEQRANGGNRSHEHSSGSHGTRGGGNGGNHGNHGGGNHGGGNHGERGGRR